MTFNFTEYVKAKNLAIDEAFRTKFIHQFKGPCSVEIGRGWYSLIFNLCEELDRFFESNLDGSYLQSFRWIQIKEKFGRLRAYFICDGIKDKADVDELMNIIQKYEKLSEHTCAVCGKSAHLRNINGVIQTLCNKHFKREMEND